jgi:histidinol-phosphate aminotransferase
MLSKKEIDNKIRPALSSIKEYKPVEPPEVLSQRVSIPRDEIIKMDANENPYGCSPAVKIALSSYQHYNSYPDPEQRDLRSALMNYTGASIHNIIAGSGSDELIELILRLFLEPGDNVLNCPPTFGMYSFCTQICAGELINIPRRKDFSIDTNLIKNAINNKTKVIFIASPNNPTGNSTSLQDIVDLLNTELIVVVDEAYAEFSDSNLIEIVTEYPNLLVLRTFSKWAGLAGLRIGYGVFPENIVNHLMKIKQPYNVNSAAQIAARASLSDIEYLQKTIEYITEERERLLKLLNTLDWLEPYKSEANFILCLVKTGNAEEITEKLKSKGIIIRYYDTPDLSNYIRISVGKPEHTDRLMEELKKCS